MHKAVEYEAEFDKNGRLLKRRWSIGPAFITTIAALILALTGHTIFHELCKLLETVTKRP